MTAKLYEVVVPAMPDQPLRELLAKLNRTRLRKFAVGLNGRQVMYPRKDVRAFVLKEIERRAGEKP